MTHLNCPTRQVWISRLFPASACMCCFETVFYNWELKNSRLRAYPCASCPCMILTNDHLYSFNARNQRQRRTIPVPSAVRQCTAFEKISCRDHNFQRSTLAAAMHRAKQIESQNSGDPVDICASVQVSYCDFSGYHVHEL